MKILTLALPLLALCAQGQSLDLVLEPQAGGQVIAVDTATLRSDLQALLRENGMSEAPAKSAGVPKLTLRPATYRLAEGIVAYSAIGYLERPGQAGALRGRIVSALRNDASLGLELRQAVLDVAAILLAKDRPEGASLKRVKVDAVVQSPLAEVPFPSLKVRVRPLDPLYPRVAMQRGVQGHVQVRVTVGREGQPIRADLVSGPEELVLTSLQSAMRWAFDPIQSPDGPVEARTVMDIPFSLSAGLGDSAIPIQDPPKLEYHGMGKHGRD